jgi:hypothetical protein
MTTKLAHGVQKAAGVGNGMRTATITAVSSSGITISVAGGQITAGVGVVTSYAPIVGDNVAVFRQDSSWMILGPTSAVNGWQPMSALGYQNGWTDRGSGFAVGQYRVTASEVQLFGELNNASVPSSGQVIVAGLPAGPAESIMLGAMGAVRVRLAVDATNGLRIFDATTSGTLQFSCTYPLDFLVA